LDERHLADIGITRSVIAYAEPGKHPIAMPTMTMDVGVPSDGDGGIKLQLPLKRFQVDVKRGGILNCDLCY
jgi:hypothetical protein